MGHHYCGPYVAIDTQGDIWVCRRRVPPCDSPTLNLVAHPPCRPRLNALVFNVDLHLVLVAEEPLCLGGFLCCPAKRRSHTFQFSCPSYRWAADTQQFIFYQISIDLDGYRRAADTLTRILLESTFIVTIEGPTLPRFINTLLRQSI